MKKLYAKGFTLVELIVVIVILGVLAVSAIPSYMNLKSEAQQSTADSIAASLSSVSVVNHLGRQASTNNGQAVDNCNDLSSLMSNWDTNFSITSGALTSGTEGDCTISGPGPKTSTFKATGAS